MISSKGIIIKNIYYMLAYAFTDCMADRYVDIAAEEFEHVDDLLATLLERGISLQLKRGLHREYVTINDNLPVLRGKIDLAETIRNRLGKRTVISCEFDELLPDNLFNQIIKTTLTAVQRNADIKADRKSNLRKLLRYFQGISHIDPEAIPWSHLTYHRNNDSYRLLHSLCFLLLQGRLPLEADGSHRFLSISDEYLDRLYEKFVLNYYITHHPQLSPCSERIAWALDSDYDNRTIFLPSMKTDISLSFNGHTLIIDTKFYRHSLQKHFDKHSIHSGNLYQIYAYVKNKDNCNTGKVSGMLLYAKTQESLAPDMDAKFGTNKIYVKTLDLNQPFEYIRRQLDAIVAPLYLQA